MRITKRRALVATAVVAATAALSLTGCAQGGGSNSSSGGQLVLWTHNAGNKGELGAIETIVSDFNKSQSKYKVKVQAFPQDSYNQSVTAAAASKKLPCILDIDGPNVPNWAWAGYLAPLTGLDATLSTFLPSTVGKYNGQTYSYGFYDAALAMISRKSTLTAAGIRIPTVDQPWTKAEFQDALDKLKATGKFQYPADLSTGQTGEWWPYAYSPFLQSFGGDLINRDGYKTADGVLNGSAAIDWAKWMRGLVSSGDIAAKSAADPTADFINGKTGILYDGNWVADGIRASLKDDAVFLPSVDLGHGAKVGGASWQWGMSKTCNDQAGAEAYLKFASADKYVALVSKATGNIPATDAAAAQIPAYQPGGDDEIFREISKKSAVVRPVTPGYPFIATAFGTAAQDIVNGADPKATLDQAVKDIDANQKSNNYFK
ncbi:MULTISPECIES: sugar ABC transporter substrate-binding protein [unclassified Leifsonia]|uniref:ABC transporter substrate-binding protein n=1 Tax=unclassified Leifsonia TaxID=2663824 RepID=UPI0008A76B97|nr:MULTISPECIES: sugar ABC transporter substrate-binding protein [unclassified Leifsonia]SEH56976.1 carbohydrate ABC transporter substrate-binding protein, CUT1 family [Leifsonia sp. CL154]SFL21876.1 carbohydrate ABC transporter substrate-binding protein, CUT1 family [Leifsonia sp. CL147]